MAYVTRRELDNLRNDEIAAAQQSAHDRYVKRHANSIESNPNAFNSTERSSFLGRRRQLQDEDRLREQELRMLREQNRGALNVENAKVLGMIGQGSEAARANAEAAKYAADAQKEAALRRAEAEMAASRARDGYFDDSGIYHPGSEVAKTESAAKATLENSRLEREARIEAAERAAQGRLDVARIDAAARENAAAATGESRVAAAQARAAQTEEAKIRRFNEMAARGDFMMAGISADKWIKMSEDEKTRVRNQIMGAMNNAETNSPTPKKKSLSDYETR